MISTDFIKSNFHKGKLSIIAGRPAMGKTSLAISLALSLAQKGRKPLFFSVEMPEEWVAKRMKMQIGEEQYRLIDGMVYVDDTPILQLSDIHKQLERLSVDFVIIDYLELVYGDEKLERTKDLSQVINTLKQFAMEFDIPVVATSQLRRASNHRDYPSLESLTLPKDALTDVDIMFIYRPEMYHTCGHYGNGKLTEEKVEFIKYHNEEASITLLHFDKATTEFGKHLFFRE